MFACCYLCYANNCQKMQENCEIHKKVSSNLYFLLSVGLLWDFWGGLWQAQKMVAPGVFLCHRIINFKMSPKTHCWFYFVLKQSDPVFRCGNTSCVQPQSGGKLLQQMAWYFCSLWVQELPHCTRAELGDSSYIRHWGRCWTFHYLGLIQSPLTNHRH